MGFKYVWFYKGWLLQCCRDLKFCSSMEVCSTFKWSQSPVQRSSQNSSLREKSLFLAQLQEVKILSAQLIKQNTIKKKNTLSTVINTEIETMQHYNSNKNDCIEMRTNMAVQKQETKQIKPTEGIDAQMKLCRLSWHRWVSHVLW